MQIIMPVLSHTYKKEEPHIFSKLFRLTGIKVRKTKRFDVDVKTYLLTLITSYTETALLHDSKAHT